MTFHLTPAVEVGCDRQGSVYSLEHIAQPYRHRAPNRRASPQIVAQQYLLNVAAIYSIPPSMLKNLNDPISQMPIEAPVGLRFAEQKSPANVTVISYSQTALGLPIWETGFSLSLVEPLRVVSSYSTVDLNVKVAFPPEDSPFLQPISVEDLIELLRLRDFSRPVINSTRLLVFKYRPTVNREDGPRSETPRLHHPTVPEHVVPGRYYVVCEVLFSLSIKS